MSTERRRLRLLAVQTSTGITSEVQVFRALLESLAHIAPQHGVAVEVLLVQGVDRHASGDDGRRAAEAFHAMPHVTVHELDVGKLGRFDTSRAQRFAKVRDVARMRLARRALLAVARQFQPDLVYSSQQRWDLRVATPLVRALRVPQVVHLHYIVGPWLGQRVVDALTTVEMVIGVSDYIRDDAIRHGVREERARALYNSVDAPPTLSEVEREGVKRGLIGELGLPDDAILVGMTARLSASKGQAELERALRPILARDRRVHLLLAGGEYPARNGLMERIRERAREHGVVSQVHILGQCSDVPRILDALDIFAHPSLQDPCPLAVLEAGAHALPVVAWRDGGTATLVADGETGILVEPMDIDGLTGALDGLIADQTLRTTMGSAGRARVETVFNPELAGSSFLDLLCEIGWREEHNAS